MISCLIKAAPLYCVFLALGFAVLIIISAEDIKQKQISVIYLVLLFVIAAAAAFTDKTTPWYLHVLGCAVGYFLLFFIRLLGEAVKKQEVLGAADTYLSGILGLMLGLRRYMLCGVFASFFALVFVVAIRKIKHYGKMHTYPFSPFLSAGFVTVVLFGDLLINGIIK